MKFDRNKAFPYPVLRPHSDDFVDKEFQSTADFSIDGNTVTVEVSYALSSNDIKKLIKDGYAVYVSVLACRDTYFSVSLPSSTPCTNKEFDNGLFRGEVEVRSYVQITKDVDFNSSEIHPDFGTDPIKYTKGDVIAQDETDVFYFDRDLFKPVTSVFDLVKNDNITGGMWELSFDQDHIQIEVSPEMKESLDNARNNPANRAILINSIYFATTMQAIEKLKQPDGAYNDYKWANIFMHNAHNSSIDIYNRDSCWIAQKLMKNPLSMLDAYVFKKGADQ